MLDCCFVMPISWPSNGIKVNVPAKLQICIKANNAPGINTFGSNMADLMVSADNNDFLLFDVGTKSIRMIPTIATNAGVVNTGSKPFPKNIRRGVKETPIMLPKLLINIKNDENLMGSPLLLLITIADSGTQVVAANPVILRPIISPVAPFEKKMTNGPTPRATSPITVNNLCFEKISDTIPTGKRKNICSRPYIDKIRPVMERFRTIPLMWPGKIDGYVYNPM